jgi:hypothetical protein
MFKKLVITLTIALLMSLDSYASQTRVYCVDIEQDDNTHIIRQTNLYKTYVDYIDEEQNSKLTEKELGNVITYSFCAVKWDENLVKSFEEFKTDLIYQMSIIHALTLDLKKENILTSYNKLQIKVTEESRKSIEEQAKIDRENIQSMVR